MLVGYVLGSLRPEALDETWKLSGPLLLVSVEV